MSSGSSALQTTRPNVVSRKSPCWQSFDYWSRRYRRSAQANAGRQILEGLSGNGLRVTPAFAAAARNEVAKVQRVLCATVAEASVEMPASSRSGPVRLYGVTVAKGVR